MSSCKRIKYMFRMVSICRLILTVAVRFSMSGDSLFLCGVLKLPHTLNSRSGSAAKIKADCQLQMMTTNIFTGVMLNPNTNVHTPQALSVRYPLLIPSHTWRLSSGDTADKLSTHVIGDDTQNGRRAAGTRLIRRMIFQQRIALAVS